jgi:TonB family protein
LAVVRASKLVPENGKGVPPTLVSAKDPIYPASAKELFISGSVQVHFRISPEGKVYDVRSVQGAAVLAEAAMEAVQARCYEPARLNGEPIDSQVCTNFDFKLD